MRAALNVALFGDFSDPLALAELAGCAEEAGWDGLFVWDHLNWTWPGAPAAADPWIALTAAALATRRLRLGPMVTPLPRRRPARLARETATLDRLSGGRLILGVGLGAPPREEFENLGEDPDPARRALLLDEGLEVLAGLWSGRPFSYQGRCLRLRQVRFLPTPLQSPRIPVWVGGGWPGPRAPLRRAARWDGFYPVHSGLQRGLSPGEMAQAVELLRRLRPRPEEPFEVMVGGQSGLNPARDRSLLQAYARAGVTWWSEVIHPGRFGRRQALERARAGPPS